MFYLCFVLYEFYMNSLYKFYINSFIFFSLDLELSVLDFCDNLFSKEVMCIPDLKCVNIFLKFFLNI